MPSPRGSRTDAIRPMTTPKSRPRVTSWRTKCHHTKSSLPASSAAEKASTAGRARPSFRPDSRLSEWRTTRGTRGLVMTLDESTGSVGESSAPSRNDSVQLRSVTRCATSATSAAVTGMATTSLRSGRRQAVWSSSPSTSRPSRKRITISATVASSSTNGSLGLKSSTSKPPCPSANPARTNRAVSDRKLRRATPETSAPATSSSPNTSTTVSNCSTADRVSSNVRGDP